MVFLNRKLCCLCASIVTALTTLNPSTQAADLTSVWDGSTGNWSDATRWDTNPFFPDNGNGGFTYDSIINVGKVTVNQAVGIEGLTLSGGSLIVDNDLNVAAESTISGGTLEGAAPVSFHDLTWTDGELKNSGGIIIGVGDTLDIAGTASRDFGSGNVLDIGGTATVTDEAFISTAQGPVTINVEAGGLFDLQADARFHESNTYSGNVFNNAGTLRKSGGSETARFSNWALNNTGAVEVQSGVISFTGGTSTHTGTFDVSPGAELELYGTTHLNAAGFTIDGTLSLASSSKYVNSGTTFEGPGTLEIRAGSFIVNTSTAIPVSTVFNGTIKGSHPVSFDNLTWSNQGIIENTAGVIIEAGGTLDIVGDAHHWLDKGGRLDIGGTAIVTGEGGISGGQNGRLNILSGGLLDIQGDTLFTATATLGNRITNEGTIRKSAGSGTSGIVDWGFTNNGIVEVQTGTIKIVTDINGTGSFTGPGTIIMSREFSPGHGAVAVGLGDNTLFESGTELKMQIGGLTAGTEYDQLNATGQITLAGELSVSMLNGFTPKQGDLFPILTAATILGTFDDESLPSLGDGLAFEVRYSSSAVTLEIVFPADINGDGFVGISDLNIVLSNWNQVVPPGDPPADPSGDGFVGIDDLAIILNSWNTGTPPADIVFSAEPEPTCVAILVLMGLGVSATRRSAIDR